MNKTILLLALLGLSFGAFPTCTDGDNGKTVLGVCQFLNYQKLCTTWQDSQTCATCTATDATLTNGACVCGNSKIASWTAANDSTSTCAASGSVVCPPSMWNDSDTCTVIDDSKACGAATAAAVCTCLTTDPSTTPETHNAGQCASPDAGNKDYIIAQHGFVAACPDGYATSATTTDKVCLPCGAGCKTCAHGTPAVCTSCADNHIIVSDVCVVVDTTNTCDASCGDGGCASFPKNCVSNCAAGYTQNKAYKSGASATDEICVKLSLTTPFCDMANADTDTKCAAETNCLTGGTWNATTEVCECESGKFPQLTAYAAATTDADGNAVAEVNPSWACVACDPACEAGKKCQASSTVTNAPECVTDPDYEPPMACDDEDLKANGCHTCAVPSDAAEGDTTKVCSLCFKKAVAVNSSNNCECENTAEQALQKDADGKVVDCKKCATACETGKFCVINADGTDGTCAGEKAVNDLGGGGGAGGDSNANILTAALAMLAIILA